MPCQRLANLIFLLPAQTGRQIHLPTVDPTVPFLMERSGSFRENTENPLLSSLPNMTRSSSSATQGDVLSFFQCVRIDPKSMVVEHKLSRPGEFKRLSSAAVGFQTEDSVPSSSKSKQTSSPSPDDVRRLKSGVRESGTKARERVKIFNDCLSVVNKCFPTIPSRKRSRLDALSNDRSNTLLPIDRSGMGKMGIQNHASTSGLELDQQKSEERTKNLVPNKRTRTSMVDARTEVYASTPPRPSGPIDKVRDVIRLPNQGEDRTISVPVDGWEKSKMKKKRTGIKQDFGSSSLATKKPVEGNQELKRGPPSRLNDSLGFRSGISNGSVAVGKVDPENSSLFHDRREQPLEKERGNLKAGSKSNSREDFSSGSPTTSTSKINANVRGPRSGPTGGGSKLSPVVQVQRSNEWELSNCTTSKLPGTFVVSNRKRTPSARAVRPTSPVSNWVQRPQKISRTARRTNLSPVISGNDEIKSDYYSSEAEEAIANNEVKNIVEKKCDENLVEKSGQNVQKLSNLLLPPRKNKGDEGGDGVRRQGRTGRGVAFGTTKQIRSSRLGIDKKESRIGRPATRKLSDRRAYTRQKHVTVNMSADFLVGSDDGHEELLAAANAVTDSAQFLSSPFWKKMEPLFRFISDVDISCLKDQVNLGSVIDTTAPAPLNADSSNLTPNSFRFGTEEIQTRNVEFSPGHLATVAKRPNKIPLCQILLSALIEEEDQVYESQFDMELNHFRSVTSKNESYYEPDNNSLQNGLLAEYQFCNVSMDERILMEIHSIGIYPDLESDLGQSGEEDINADISRLDEEYQEQVSKKKGLLSKLISSASEAKELQEKEFEERALDKLVGMAYEKYMSCWGRNAQGMKGGAGKMAKQAAIAFVKRALERYHEFEMTGKSCFDEGLYRDMFLSSISRLTNGQPINSQTDAESGKIHLTTSGCSPEFRISGPTGPQQSPSNNQEMFFPETPLSANLDSEQNTGKEDTWSNKVKRRELLLDDVGGTNPSSLLFSAKGKRSERDREGKSRNGTGKIGRPVKGERKSKAKPKQKTTNPMPAPIGDGSLGNTGEIGKGKIDNNAEILEDPIDLSGLQLPGMEDIGGDDFAGQGEDIGSWLDIVEDDGLHDHDFMAGLEIPMDDLTGII